MEEFRESYLNPHVGAMVREERRNDLSNLFILLRPLPRALVPLITEFEQHVTSQGESCDPASCHMICQTCMGIVTCKYLDTKLQQNYVEGIMYSVR